MRIIAIAATLMAVSVWAQAASAQSDLPVCGVLPGSGDRYECQCAAPIAGGSVWGSGPYTGDSNICQAALHAGVITANGGPVTALRMAGQSGYTGSVANGVTTRDWGSYGNSLAFETKAAASACAAFSPAASPITCSCPAAAERIGSVWGSSPFTGDSDICAAAQLEGLIGANGGTVTLIAAPGLASYKGISSNGVASRDWGSYTESFVFDWNSR